ncbi:unnamed protein product [Mytilus edulis]|uniref:Uncharacterized protein n=1 Tax=Mytilus edulis TaxID=6550 RepID=A0A8S3TAJ8_MYTED|nr:unnamed protein product [Mytilus edulis]
MNKIIETDPFLGFPECCRLFTENRNSTTLDVSCFKWPSAVLVNDIEKLRMEGINNYMNGLKYVILIHILTLGYSRVKCQQEYDSETDCSLVKRNIDAQDCKHIFKICYNMDLEVHTSDIEYVCKVLTERFIVNQDGAYYFQHKAIQDSVLISYSKINPNATIPLLTFGHLVDIVYPQNYKEQKDQIVIKISGPCYPALAKKINSILNSLSYQIDCYRLKESKLFTENDIDLVYQLILSIENEKDHHRHVISNYLGHFIPLYLLRNIGKLDDQTLTVKHTKDQMLISVTIKDKNIVLSIDPQTSLINASYSNCKDIFKWLLKNTDHTLLDFTEMFKQITSEDFGVYKAAFGERKT